MVGRALTSEGSFLARLGIGSPGHFQSLTSDSFKVAWLRGSL